MIHVDVRRRVNNEGMTIAFEVQTSTDGAGWAMQYQIPVQIDEHESKAKRDAEHIARVFLHGIRYAGRDAYGTSCGYGL